MKSSKVFNNISDKLKTYLSEKRLKPGQVVVVQMTNGVPNPEPDEKERAKQPMLYPKVQMLTQFRIWDDGQKDDTGKEVGGYIDVGLVDSWDGEKPRAFRSFVTGSNPSQANAPIPSFFQGKFQLAGGNVREEELYEIFLLSPQREGSPCPDSNVEVIFKFVDAKAEVKSTMNSFAVLKKAMELADGITESKAAAVMAALNQPTYQDKEVLLAKVKELSKDKPEDFIKAYESKQTPVISLIKDAIGSGLVTYDISTGTIKLGAVEITKIKVSSNEALPQAFAQYLETSVNGSDVLANIQSQVSAKQPVTAEAKAPVREVVTPASLGKVAETVVPPVAPESPVVTPEQ
jgi:hypothetical protein